MTSLICKGDHLEEEKGLPFMKGSSFMTRASNRWNDVVAIIIVIKEAAVPD